MTIEQSELWIAVEELARRPDKEWKAARRRDQEARSADSPF
jgi:hypothetical protein